MGDAACWAHVVCPGCGRVTPDDGPRPLVVLIGSMGAGKTTVGRRVADRLGWRFVDNDERFLERTGTTASFYASEHGEDEMHRVEWELLREAVALPEPVVLAAPGSVADAPSLDLSEGFVVWLRAGPDVIARRIRAGDHRPLLGDDPAAVLDQLHTGRVSRYGELADVTMPDADRPPDDLADEIVDAWCRHAGHR